MRTLDRLTSSLFYLLLFITPLILWPKTSEIFEFNKIVFLYTSTVIILFFWMVRMVFTRKIVFQKTLLDFPLLLFLLSNTVSTIFSIDPRTSFFGYYSRFNGGLISTYCYALLYWAYVSNMDQAKTKTSLKVLMLSSIIVSIYAVLQHFGIDKDLWADDVVNRVFSTLGQPNWLAAWVVTLISITWGLLLTSEKSLKNKLQGVYNFSLYTISGLLFATLIFTKSRSGFIGFGVSYIFFWAALLLTKILQNTKWSNSSTKTSFSIREFPFRIFLIFSTVYLSLVIIFGTPWSGSIENKIKKTTDDATKRSVSSILESGSAGSGQIRKIVWKGAFSIWKDHPFVGSGVETFAYSYQLHKPPQHNLTAEWDYVYNKAHNEYLNYLATTGILGLSSYLLLVLFSFMQIAGLGTAYDFKEVIFNAKKALSLSKNKLTKVSDKLILKIALTASFVSLLVTNFFGFSVVSTSLLFFLIPAMGFSLERKPKIEKEIKAIYLPQIIVLTVIAIIGVYSLLITGKYWYSDYLYAKANRSLDTGDIEQAQKYGQRLLELSSKEPQYIALVSQIYAQTALYLFRNEDTELYKNYVNYSKKYANDAVGLSPANVYFQRNLASIDLLFSGTDNEYLKNAQEDLAKAIKLAPTDAKLLYNLGLIHLKLGQLDKAEEILKYTIEIKDNYAEARYALALVYYNEKKTEETQKQIDYILTRIDPNNDAAKKLSEEMAKTK